MKEERGWVGWEGGPGRGEGREGGEGRGGEGKEVTEYLQLWDNGASLPAQLHDGVLQAGITP